MHIVCGPDESWWFGTQAQQVLSMVNSVGNLNSFNSNGFKGLASFPNIPGLTGPLPPDFHPDMALGAHLHSQNQLSGPATTRNVLMPGTGGNSFFSRCLFSRSLSVNADVRLGQTLVALHPIDMVAPPSCAQNLMSPPACGFSFLGLAFVC